MMRTREQKTDTNLLLMNSTFGSMQSHCPFSHAHHRHAGHPIVDDIKYGGRGGTLGSAAEEVAAARSVVELLPATPSFPAESYDALCEGRLGLGVA